LKSIKPNEMLVSNFYRQHFSGNHKTFIAEDHKYMAKGNRLSDWPENKARNNQQHNKKNLTNLHCK